MSFCTGSQFESRSSDRGQLSGRCESAPGGRGWRQSCRSGPDGGEAIGRCGRVFSGPVQYRKSGGDRAATRWRTSTRLLSRRTRTHFSRSASGTRSRAGWDGRVVAVHVATRIAPEWLTAHQYLHHSTGVGRCWPRLAKASVMVRHGTGATPTPARRSDGGGDRDRSRCRGQKNSSSGPTGKGAG